MLNKDLVCRGVKDQEYIRNSTELKVKKKHPKTKKFPIPTLLCWN